MTANKNLVESCQAALANLDWTAVGACLTDDVERVEWADGFPASGIPVRGKAAVLKEMEAPRRFEIRARRMTEENNVVVSESVVRAPLEGGGTFVGEACTIYELAGGKIRKISSFVAENKHPT